MFLDLPLGHTTGPPNDPEYQRFALMEGLHAAHDMPKPEIVDLPYRWVDDEWKADPLSWSRRRQDAGESGQRAGDTRTARNDEPVYQNDADRAAADATAWDNQCQVCLGLPTPD